MKRILIAFVTLATGWTVAAQQSNQVSAASSSAFRVISERNIFDPNRRPHRTSQTTRSSASSRQPVDDVLSLVGTMSYGKGDFAFFDGTHSEYRQILEPASEIAGYKVTEIRPGGVKLENGKQIIEMKVGTQLRRDDANIWQLIVNTELPAPPPESATAAPIASSEPAGDIPAGGTSDILKKLMQKREQELK